MRVLQQTGPHQVPFLQHPDWPNKSVLKNHLRMAATAADQPQPSDEEVRVAYNLFWSTHKHPLPQSPPNRNQAHLRPPEQVGLPCGDHGTAVLLQERKGLKVTLWPGKTQGHLWMLCTPTARKFNPPPLPQDPMRGTTTICWRCGTQALATPWPVLQLLAPHHHTRTAHATPEQHQWLCTHFEPAPADVLATVAWNTHTTAVWRIRRGTFHTKQAALTYPVLAKQHSTTPEAPAHPVNHRWSRGVLETRTIEWTTYHPQRAYLLQYIYKYLAQRHERNSEYVQMNVAATEIICWEMGVYATSKIKPATSTPWATTTGRARVHAYQLTTSCCPPRPDEQNTVIFADTSGTTGLTPAAGGQLWNYGWTRQANCGQHLLTGATIFEASLQGELKSLAIIVDDVGPVFRTPQD